MNVHLTNVEMSGTEVVEAAQEKLFPVVRTMSRALAASALIYTAYAVLTGGLRNLDDVKKAFVVVQDIIEGITLRVVAEKDKGKVMN